MQFPQQPYQQQQGKGKQQQYEYIEMKHLAEWVINHIKQIGIGPLENGNGNKIYPPRSAGWQRC